MNNYQKTIKKIEKVTDQIEANAQREAETRQRSAAVEKSLEELEGVLKKALVDADPKMVKSVEADIDAAKNELLRTKRLIDALQSEREELAAELERQTAERDSLFAQNAVKVLKETANSFDDHAREVIRLGKVLIACHSLLRDAGHGHVFRETIGPATDVLGTFKLPVIRGFTLAQYNNRTQVQAGPVLNEMRTAIEEA